MNTANIAIRMSTLDDLMQLRSNAEEPLDSVIWRLCCLRDLVDYEDYVDDLPVGKHRAWVLGQHLAADSIEEVFVWAVATLTEAYPVLLDALHRCDYEIGGALEPTATFSFEAGLDQYGWEVTTPTQGQELARKVLQSACELVGLSWGNDVRIEFGG